MGLPSKVEYVIIGAGVHGLSTAYHLSKYLKESGRGDGRDVLVIEKSSIAAGASGVACGNVRCNYYQEPMTNLMIHCMDIWESDPDYFAYNSVGYLTASSRLAAWSMGQPPLSPLVPRSRLGSCELFCCCRGA